MSPVVAAEHSRNCPGNLLLLLVPSQAGPPDPPTRGPRHIHSFHWVCPFQLGKAIWILFKRLFILEKKRQGISGLLMKSGPWWYCWWRACSVSWSISSCVRGLRQVLASNLSFKIITIRKLGPSKPQQVLTLFCCREMSCRVSLSGKTGKRPVEPERKAQPGILCFVLTTLWP